MDAWWTPLVRAIYDPVLGPALVDRIRALNTFHQAPGPRGIAFFDGWNGYVERDLRTLLGKRVRGRYSRRYCGGGSLRKGKRFERRRRRALRRCRGILVGTLLQAKQTAEARYGTSLESIDVPATCAEQTPLRATTGAPGGTESISFRFPEGFAFSSRTCGL